jgi:hypothetical protein
MALTARNLLAHFPPLAVAVVTDEGQLAQQRQALLGPIVQQRRLLFEPLALALHHHALELQAVLGANDDGVLKDSSQSASSGGTRNSDNPSTHPQFHFQDSARVDGRSSGGSSPLTLLRHLQDRGALSSRHRQHYLRSVVAYLRAVDAAVFSQLTDNHNRSTSPSGSSFPASPSVAVSHTGQSWPLGRFPTTIPAVRSNNQSPSFSASPPLTCSTLLLQSSGLLDVLLAHHWSAERGVGFGPLITRLDAGDESDGQGTAPSEAAHATFALLEFAVQLQHELAICMKNIMQPLETVQTPFFSSPSAMPSSAATTGPSTAHASLSLSPARSPSAPLPEVEEASGPLAPEDANDELPLSHRLSSVVEMDPANTPRDHDTEESQCGFVLHYESSSSRRDENDDEL